MRRWLYLVVLVILAVLAWFARPPATVEVVRPVVQDVREVVVATGRLQARQSTNLGFDLPGLIARVHVRRGQRVSAGHPLVSLDPTNAMLALREAEARVSTARAELERVQSGPSREDVQRARSRLELAQVGGRRQIEAARQRLRDLHSARPEAVSAAEAVLAQARASLKAAREAVRAQEQAARTARANREAAEADLRRFETLYAAGAVSAAEVERVRLNFERAAAEEEAARARLEAEGARVRIAQEQVRAAREQLKLAQRPASQAQVEAARADLKALEARVAAEVRDARLDLAALLRSPRPEEVRAAEARYREAMEAARSARERLSRTVLYAPFTATVLDVHKDEGAPVVPGEVVVSLAEPNALEVVVDLDEENLPRLKVGQRATLVATGSVSSAVLTQIDPQVDVQRGTARLRLRPLSLPAFARIGMTFDVSLEVGAWPGALTVPLGTILQTSSGASVMVVRGGRVQALPVEVLGKSDRWVALKGLTPQDAVVVDPTRVRPGQRVRVRWQSPGGGG